MQLEAAAAARSGSCSWPAARSELTVALRRVVAPRAVGLAHPLRRPHQTVAPHAAVADGAAERVVVASHEAVARLQRRRAPAVRYYSACVTRAVTQLPIL